jgi:hypothetical protein
MMYDRTTGMVRLKEPVEGNDYQKWVLTRVIDDQVRYRIQNIGDNGFLTAEREGQHVTVQRDIELERQDTWLFPQRRGNDNNFTSTITQVPGHKDLLNSGDFLVTGRNGQMWRFVVVA